MSNYNNILVYDPSTAGIARAMNDDQITFAGDLVVSGDFTVTGTTTTVDSQIITTDAYLFMNSSNSSTSNQQSGFIMLDKVDAVVTTTGTTFSNTSDEITVSSDLSGSLSAGDLIAVFNAGVDKNNGLYEVASVTATAITINISPTLSGFVLEELQDETGANATVAKAYVSIFRSDPANSTFEYGSGSDSSITFSDVAASAGVTLDGAYDNAVLLGSNPVEITGSTAFQWQLGTANYTVNCGTFQVNSSIVRLDSTGAGGSRLSASAGELLLQTTNANQIKLDSAGSSWIDAGTYLQVNTGNKINFIPTTDFVVTTGNNGDVDLNVGMNVTIDTTNGSIDFNSAHTSSWTGGAGLALTATTSTLDLTASAGTVNITATGASSDLNMIVGNDWDVDVDGRIELTATANNGQGDFDINYGTGAGASYRIMSGGSVQQSFTGGANSFMQFNAWNTIKFTDDGSASVGKFWVDCITMDIDLSGSLDADIATLDVLASGNATIESTAGTVKLDAIAGLLDLDGHTGVNIEATTSNLVLTATAGKVDINAGTEVDIDAVSLNAYASGTGDVLELLTDAGNIVAQTSTGAIKIRTSDNTASGNISIEAGEGGAGGGTLLLSSNGNLDVATDAFMDIGSTTGIYMHTNTGPVQIHADADAMEIESDTDMSLESYSNDINLTASSGSINLKSQVEVLNTNSTSTVGFGALLAHGVSDAGDILAIDPANGRVVPADASSATLRNPVAVNIEGVTTAGTSYRCHLAHGLPTWVYLGGSTPTEGDEVYLSASSAGQASLTPPAGFGNRVTRLGFVLDSTGVAHHSTVGRTLHKILWMPQYITDL